MPQTTINVRIDEQLKKQLEDFCDETGFTISALFNIFSKKVVREQRIPFTIELDPFYSKSNIEYLERVISDLKSGKAKLEEHQLLEDEE